VNWNQKSGKPKFNQCLSVIKGVRGRRANRTAAAVARDSEAGKEHLTDQNENVCHQPANFHLLAELARKRAKACLKIL
jgi:hypothetical protein